MSLKVLITNVTYLIVSVSVSATYYVKVAELEMLSA